MSIWHDLGVEFQPPARSIMLSDISHVLLSPAGRCDRRGLLIIALVLLTLQVVAGFALLVSGASIHGPAALALDLLFVWLGTVALVKRLHDIDRRGWWLAAATVVLLLWSVVLTIGLMLVLPAASFAPGEPGYLASIAGLMLPVFAAILWLHCVPGQPTENRFAPVPDGWGFAHGPVREARVASTPVAV